MYKSPFGRICRHRSLAILLLAVMVMSVVSAPAAAGDSSETSPAGLSISQVHVGFGGRFKVGRWTPVSVQIEVKRPCKVSWSVEVPDPYGNPTVFPGPDTQFKTAGMQTLRTVIRTGRLEGGMRVRASVDDDHQVERHLKVGEQAAASLRPALEQSVVLVAVLGQSDSLSDLPKLERPVQIVELSGVDELPSDQTAYDGLDVLFINGSPAVNGGKDAGTDRDWTAITKRQSAAIRDWVSAGGRLVLAVGDETSAFQACPLNEWVSRFVPLQGTRRLRSLSALESFGEQSSPISVSRRQPATVARIELSEANLEGEPTFTGTVLVMEQREPLIVRTACGFGRITFCGINLDRPPLSDWDALPNVMQQLLLDEYPQVADQSHKQGQRLSKTGVSDLATQMLSALEDFPQLVRTSTWTVMLSLMAYLLIVGPLDYFVVHRLFRNPWMTWVTFPAIVAATAGVAIWSTNAANTNEVRLNQIDVVDIDGTAAGQQFVRTNSWMTVYSPHTQRNRVAVLPRPLSLNSVIMQSGERAKSPAETPEENLAIRFLLSWAGTPETGFGGMYRSGGVEYGRPRYRYAADGSSIDDLPMTMWSTTTFIASRTARADPIVESDLTSRGYGLVSGTITHHLRGPLREWMLAYGPGVYFGEVNPRTGETSVIESGAVWTPDAAFVRQQELRGYLTRTRLREVEGGRANEPEYRLSQSTYDRFGRDPAAILRMITFYRRAGGEKYTGLRNDSLRHLDCSELLKLDRAVLFARLDEPAADLNWNDKSLTATRRSTFVRIVLPVKTNK